MALIKQRVGELPGRTKSPFLAVTLYRDISGLLTQDDRWCPEKGKGPEKKKKFGASKSTQQELDDEDELLYGSSEASVGMFGTPSQPGKEDFDMERKEEEEEWYQRHFRPISSTFWLCGVKQNGNLELYSMPDFTLRFVSLNFPQAPSVLVDNMSTRAAGSDSRILEGLSPVTEIAMKGLGHKNKRPVLMARTADSELLMYQVNCAYHVDTSSLNKFYPVMNKTVVILY